MLESCFERAKEAIQSADALLIGAGAGMGVDSGLPDFRGDEGFWKAYPPFRGRRFPNVSNPSTFHHDPVQAWGFFGHRLNLYRDTQPHAGFGILRRWGETRPLGYFVFTSNVDGHFQKAGFSEDRILECHGSIHFVQCAGVCSNQIWPADDIQLEIDDATIRCRSDLPRCPRCGYVARPNIVMFGDNDCLWGRQEEQRLRYARWCERVAGRNVVAIEIGAGLAIPTVREECESSAQILVRINVREAETPSGGISLPVKALEALQHIDRLLKL